MTGFEIRDWVDSDFDRFYQLSAAHDPLMEPGFARRLFAGDISPMAVKKVATIAGLVVGVAAAMEPLAAPYVNTRVIVDQAYWRQGIGTNLMAVIDKVCSGRALGASCSDTDPYFVQFARAHGFELKQHGIMSVLKASEVPNESVDSGLTIDVIADAELTDKQTCALDDLMTRAATNPEATELGWTINVEVMRKFTEHPLWVVSWDGDKPVAMTVADMVPSGVWLIEYTVVDQEYRGRGLAMAIKDVLHRYGIEQGATEFQTENEEGNTAIRALNKAMGYQIIGGEYRLLRPADTA